MSVSLLYTALHAFFNFIAANLFDKVLLISLVIKNLGHFWEI